MKRTPDRILIVDDTSASLKLLTTILNQSGYTVFPADSGELALETVHNCKPDLIFLDIKMPGMDGFEVLKCLKENPETVSIPVIMISSADDIENQLKCFRLGAVDFIIKPFIEEILLARTKTHLELARLRNDFAEKSRLYNETELLGKVGGWEFDIETMEQTWSEEVYRIHEVDLPYKPTVAEGINFYTPASRPIIEQAVQRAIEYGEPFDVELEIITAKGNLRTVHAIGKADKPHHKIVGFFQDITAQKKKDEELQETKVILQAAMDCSPAGIAIADAPDGKLRYVNDAGLLIRGSDRQTVVNGVGIEQYVNSWKLFDLDGRQLRIDEVPLARAVMFGETNSREFIIRPKEGEERTVLANAAPIKNASGMVIAGIVVFTDITERKKTEQQLVSISRRLQLATSSARLGVWEWDLRKNILIWNDRMFELYGITRDTFTNNYEAWLSGLHPEDRETAISESQAALNGEKDYNSEFRVIHPDGVVKYIRATGLVMVGTDGAAERMIGINANITERKTAEAVKTGLLLRQRAILDNLPMMAWLKDTESRLEMVNEAYAKACGCSVEECIGKTDLELFPKELAEKYIEGDRDVMSSGHRSEGEELITSPLGLRWHLYYKTPVYGARGQIAGTAGIALDVTDRKKSEESLLHYQAMLDRTECITHVGSWEWEVATDTVTWSEEMFRILQLNPTDGAPSFAEQSRIFHPEDMKELKRVVDIALAEGTPYEIELRAIRPDAEIRYCLASGFVNRSPDGIIKQLFGSLQDITERKQQEEALRQREAMFRAVAELSPMAIYASRGSDQKATYINDSFYKTFGYSMKDVPTVGHWWLKAYPDEKYRQQVIEQWTDNIEQANKNETDVKALECICTCKNGSEKIIVWVGKTIGDDFWAFGYDYTDRKKAEEEKSKLEAQLNQAQKMESVGRLAGGVAHDFNNMLTVILGHAQLGLMRLEPDHPLRSNLTEIGKTAERSADLTRQLLAFARKQTIAPKVLDLNETISGMLNMLQRLIGEDINLNWHPAPNVWPVKLDPSQIDQILANLCVNARDSIANVGKIRIETGRCTIDEEYCLRNPGFIVGEYVQLSVSDDGCGMDKVTLAQIFEPFFTTKGLGEGTGLGLATVYGVVKQNNGFINVYSEPGLGTNFTIYLPRYVGESEQARVEASVVPANRGKETILLVEDELAILNITSMILRNQGYTILAANTPSDAFRLAAEHSDKIHLLLTDVVMPEMNGKDLAKKLQSLYPQLKCLYMSGYTSDVIAQHGVLDEGVYFIQKPYSLPDLATKVRDVLDG